MVVDPSTRDGITTLVSILGMLQRQLPTRFGIIFDTRYFIFIEFTFFMKKFCCCLIYACARSGKEALNIYRLYKAYSLSQQGQSGIVTAYMFFSSVRSTETDQHFARLIMILFPSSTSRSLVTR